MKNYIYDEHNGLWYKLVGDYYLPCIAIEESHEPLGIWGQRHFEYIKKNKPTIYTALLMKGTLNSYLAEIDKQANLMYFQLIKQLAEKENITEQLKSDNQFEWVARMNNIRHRAAAVVNKDIIYN